METKNMTCIVCPLGCQMEVIVDTAVTPAHINVTGNTCKRGEAYAQTELLAPMRTLTSTIAVNGGDLPVVPVKTVPEIPKALLMQCMEVIRRRTCTAPIKRGDVLIADILSTGSHIIACADVNKL